ncbi:MAG TPA: hypothetical protein VNN77_04600 [candidate division Zixibacteria bacterium]|nr:hypothetical protein [candidate division Zixibacteria bacterium]
MSDDLAEKKPADESTVAPCPCRHPSHGPKGCENFTEADEEVCSDCEEHAPYTDAV